MRRILNNRAMVARILLASVVVVSLSLGAAVRIVPYEQAKAASHQPRPSSGIVLGRA